MYFVTLGGHFGFILSVKERTGAPMVRQGEPRDDRTKQAHLVRHMCGVSFQFSDVSFYKILVKSLCLAVLSRLGLTTAGLTCNPYAHVQSKGISVFSDLL